MDRASYLLGRADEQRQVVDLVAHARNGRGGAIVVVGEPGIGKTSLLQAVASRAMGVRVLGVTGYEAEQTMPFAAVHRLVLPLREHLAALPPQHQQALAIASGGEAGPAPDRYLVGLALLGLLAATSTAEPVLCTVDDVHLLDAESRDALAFVARRVGVERIALVFARREPEHDDGQLAGIEVLRLEGLALEPAIELLRRSLPDPIDPAAAALVVAATGGNPLALVDLAGEFTVKQLTDSSLAADPMPIGRHLEASYIRRVRLLRDDVQLWLLVAAADSTGDADLIGAAAKSLGLPETAADEAEAAGLVAIDTKVSFRHALVKSAAYTAAQGTERRRVHRALASAADDLGLVELEAWHAARAVLGTDADVADRLERVAELAGRRGGSSSRAAVLARASALTPEGSLREARRVAAAEAAMSAGAAVSAKQLLDEVDEELLEPPDRGRAIRVRAGWALFAADPSLVRGAAEMLAAADAFHGVDALEEQNALIRAFSYALPPDRHLQGVTLDELGRRMAAGADLRPGVASTILRALGAFVLRPYAEAVPFMRAAVAAIDALDGGELVEYGPIAIVFTTALWDADARRRCLRRTAAAARDAGALQLVESELWVASLAELKGGTPRRSAQLVAQVRELRRAIGYDAENVVNVAYLAWSGAPRELVEQIAYGAGAVGFYGVQVSAVAALALRDLAEGAYEEAYLALKALVDDPFLQVTPLEFADFVEAAVRAGRPAEALPLVERLDQLAVANGSAWTRGVAARARALVDEDPEPLYREAVDVLSAAAIPVEAARARLLYGQWLRRRRRRREAADQLRAALVAFEQAEAPAFAEQVRGELAAAGYPTVVEQVDAGPSLTAQERTVAKLAASGSTNAEIGAVLFISSNTVDYHLRKVFQKLGVTSRRQLAEHLGRLS